MYSVIDGQLSTACVFSSIHPPTCTYFFIQAWSPGRQASRQAVRQAGRLADRQACTQASRKANRQADRQTGRQAGPSVAGGRGAGLLVLWVGRATCQRCLGCLGCLAGWHGGRWHGGRVAAWGRAIGFDKWGICFAICRRCLRHLGEFCCHPCFRQPWRV